MRQGYNRVLAEEFEALKLKRVDLVKYKVEAHSQGDLRENFGFKAAKDAIRDINTDCRRNGGNSKPGYTP